MTFLSFINFYLIPGVLVGFIYASGAIGITLLFSVLRFANLAHGDMITLGAYLCLATIGLGLPIWLAVGVAALLSAVILVCIDKLFFAYLRPKPRIMMVMASLGVAFMLRASVQVIWGIDPLSYIPGISRPNNWYGLIIKWREIWTVVCIASVILSLFVFMKYSRWGKAMRAYANNDELAALCGIDINKMIMITWIIVAFLVVLSGFFMALNTELKTMMGWHLLLPMFAAAILGGVGRIEGAILGGLVIGISEELSVLLFPSQYKSAVAFVLLLLVLLIRPRGLLQGKVL